MPELEPVTLPPEEHGSILYSKLFAECLPGMRKFLDVLFESIFQAWGAFVVVAIEGESDDRVVEFASVLSPLCTAINDLGLRDRCIECDRRMAHEVAHNREPLLYWCDWGLRDVAVPILVHDVTVGVIVCGQKRLYGEADLEGQRILEKFVEENDITDSLEELQEKRSLCPEVSPSQVKELVDILSATSLFISQVLYNNTERVEKLRKALVDKDAMLKDVVHQINQPLHGILADCENLVSDKFSADRKAMIIKYLPSRVKHLAMEVESVQFAEQGGMLSSAKQNLSNVNLSKLLIEIGMNYRGYAEDKYVRIDIDTAISDSIGEILIDRDHLAVALTNVVYNAVKYAFPKTTVMIGAELANQELRILVIDNGIEIKFSERESIFSKHVRTALAKNFVQSGLGIGLFVTRELMRSMGGDAAVVESNPTIRMYKQFHEYRTTIALTLPQSTVLRLGGNK